MNNGIDWADVGSGGRFENIVSVLLSTLHPDSQRIDGAGGDSGRDHQFQIDGRIELWQSKYFLRRLNESQTRKRQIANSLVEAAQLQPDSWTLVTPMTPNPEELKWFNKLQESYPFPLTWRGGEWLDARLAGHPSIVRHFSTPNDQYVALLRELKQEQEALVDGLPAARERIEALARRINDSNPFYHADFTVRDGQISNVSLRPAYVGAEIDSPITASFAINVGETDADHNVFEDFRRAIEWGDEVELPDTHVRDVVVDSPHGLGVSLTQARIQIGPAAPQSVSLPLQLVVQSPDGATLAAIPTELRRRVVGARGITLDGSDSTGIIRVRVRLEPATRRLHLTMSFDEIGRTFPAPILPVLRFMRIAVTPNILRFGPDLGSLSEPLPISDLSGPSEAIVEFVENLARLQDATNQSFPVPLTWSPDDAVRLKCALELATNGRSTIGRGSLFLTGLGPEGLALAESGESQAFYITKAEPYVAQIGEHSVFLGTSHAYYGQSANFSVEDRPANVGDSYRLIVTPDPDCEFEVMVGSGDSLPQTP